MEKQGRSGILFRCFKEHTKIGLDICAGTCYNIVRKCGHRTSASISAFQAEEVGSIPIARSMQKQRWFVENRRCFLSFYLTFYLITYFKQQNLLFREPTGGFIMKKKHQATGQAPPPGLPPINAGEVYVVTSLEEEVDLLRMLQIRKEQSAQKPGVHK